MVCIRVWCVHVCVCVSMNVSALDRHFRTLKHNRGQCMYMYIINIPECEGIISCFRKSIPLLVVAHTGTSCRILSWNFDTRGQQFHYHQSGAG